MLNKVESRREFLINFLYFAVIVGIYCVTVKYAFGYIFPFIFAPIKEKHKKWMEIEIFVSTLSLTVKKAKTKIREVDIVPKVKGEDK